MNAILKVFTKLKQTKNTNYLELRIQKEKATFKNYFFHNIKNNKVICLKASKFIWPSVIFVVIK